MQRYKQSFRLKTAYTAECKQTVVCHTCMYNRLPEDEPSGSNHVEDIVKIIIVVKVAFCWFIS